MTPPDLARDAPVLDVAHPFEIGVFPVVGHKADAAVFHRLDCRFRQRLDLDVPLIGEKRFDNGAGAVAARHHQFVVLDFFQQAGGVEVGDDLLARLETVHADVTWRNQLAFVFLVFANRGVGGEDVDQPAVNLFADGELVAVALPHAIVIEVVRRGDFDAAGAELGVDVFLVGNDGNLATGERQFQQFANHVFVAFIMRVDSHGAVAEQGFRARGGDHQMTVAVGQRVTHVPHVAVFFFVEHFQIGHRGVQFRIPVDQTLAAVDQAVFVEANKHFPDCFGQSFVHGEAFMLPVQRGAEAAQLAGDVAAGFLAPLPDAFDEGFAAEVVPGFAFGFKLALHHHLGGDAGVVGARLPQRVIAFHAVIANQGVHHRVVEAVAHVQAAGDIRRRNHDAIGRAAGMLLRRKPAVGFPGLVPLLFDGVRVVGFFQRHIGLLAPAV